MSALAGNVALVTGSATGIGKAIVEKLAEGGASIIINYLHHEMEAIVLEKELTARGVKVMKFKADITARPQVQAMVQAGVANLGPISILVNNAGVTFDKTLAKMTPEDWDRTLGVNLTGAFNVTREVLPHMLTVPRGRIVNISSVVAQTGAFGQSNYAASKAGLIGFTRSCALELARKGITVNAICPGYIETGMLQQVPDAVRTDILKKIPVGRFGSPEEIASVVDFLIREGSYITGQCIDVNGGIFAG